MERPALLAVDDDPDVLRAVARDLRARYGQDYRVLRAESGAVALELLDELKQRGDAVAMVLSDQRMPRMEGVALLAGARERHPDTKRVLLTAYADTSAAIAAINQSQVDYYLLKPWDPPEERLYPVLDDLLQDWRAGFRPGYEGVRIVGDRWSARTHDIKDFLARSQVPYRFFDVETSDEGREIVARLEDARLPVVVIPNGPTLARPTVADVAAHVGLQTRAGAPFYDLAIVGAGPAGLAAAVYGASEGLRTVMIEREAPGGQAGTSSLIENYLGFPAGLSGSDLARRAVTQARRFGVEILAPQEVKSLRVEGPYRHITLADDTTIACHVLMLGMGVSWRLLAAEGAERLTGRGLFYGAAMTEAMGCQGEDVFVVGGGNSAGQAAMHLAQFARQVTVVARCAALEIGMSQYLVERLRATPNVRVRLHSEISACRGTDRLEGITVADRNSGVSEDLPARFVFVFIGARPCTDWLQGVVALDERGFVLTGPDLEPQHLEDWPFAREPYLLEASVPGVFAAGDVRHESVKRVASAVGEGSAAVHFMHRYRSSL